MKFEIRHFIPPNRAAYVRWGQVVGFAEFALLTGSHGVMSDSENLQHQMNTLRTILTENIHDDGQLAGDATAEQLVEFGVLVSNLESFSSLGDFDEHLSTASFLSMSRVEAASVLDRLRAALGVRTRGLAGWIDSVVRRATSVGESQATPKGANRG